MNYKGHLLSTYSSLFFLFPILLYFVNLSQIMENFFGFLIFLTIGALLPDIDHPRSKISYWLPKTLLSVGIIFFIGNTIFIDQEIKWHNEYALTLIFPICSFFLTKIISKNCGHRTLTHSLLFEGICLAIFLIFSLMKQQVQITWLGLYWGVAMHIYFDRTTPKGVAQYYPFNKKFYRSIPPFWIHQILFIIFILLIGLSAYYFFTHNFTFFNIEEQINTLRLKYFYH